MRMGFEINTASRHELDVSDANVSFETFVFLKMQGKGMSRQEVLQYMLGSAVRTTKQVNKSLG